MKLFLSKLSILSVFLSLVLISVLSTSCHKESSDLDVRDLKLSIKDLSSSFYGGRESGSKDSRRVALYLAERYKQAGLYPAFLDQEKNIDKQKDKKTNSKNKYDHIKHKYVDKSLDSVLANSHLRDYIQPFRFKAGLQIPPGNFLKVNVKTNENFKLNIIPIPFSKPGSVSAPFVFAGFCIDYKEKNWEDFKNFDPKGKILLCLRHGPGGAENSEFKAKMSFRSKWKNLSKLGALGVVFLGRDGFDSPNVNNFMPAMKKGAISVFANHHSFFEAYPFLKTEYEKMLNKKKSNHIGKELGEIFIQTKYQVQNRIAYNAGTYLKKPKPGQRLLVLGAHLDHLGLGYFSSLGKSGKIHNGADDNASGTAVVLELATYLKSVKNIIPDNANILFLNFDAEERGLIGSRYYLTSNYFRKPEVMVNLDMVGRLRKSRGLSIQGCQTADFRWQQILSRAFAKNLGGGSFHSNSEKNNLCSKIVGQNGMKLRFVQGGRGPSDHSGFYQKESSVAFFFTGSHRQYHTQDDLIELINFKGLFKITQMVLDVMIDWASLEKPLLFVQAKTEASRPDFDFKLRLGIIPGNYNSGEEGLEVYDVRSDAPVFKTGLQKGDIIIKMGQTKISDINDLMEFLSNASSEQKYVLDYKRNGKIYSVQTELMKK